MRTLRLPAAILLALFTIGASGDGCAADINKALMDLQEIRASVSEACDCVQEIDQCLAIVSAATEREFVVWGDGTEFSLGKIDDVCALSRLFGKRSSFVGTPRIKGKKLILSD